jgi:DNA-directed RNA polymerase specialized sigma24 family protein
VTPEFFSQEFDQGYAQTVHLYAIKSFRDPEEWAQAAWSKAWEKRNQWQGEGSFLSWVNMIGARQYFAEYKKRGRLVEMPERDLHGDRWQQSRQTEIAMDCRRLVKTVPPHVRAAVVRRYIWGYSEKEGASMVGKSVNANKLIVHRGLLAMRTTAI